jgi:hypothetical protein
VSFLPHRVQSCQALGTPNGRRPAPAFLVLASQPLERDQVKRGQTFAVLCQPLVVTPGEKFAAIDRDSILEPARLNGLLEVGDVQPQASLGTPLQSPWPNIDQAPGVRQRTAQSVENLTQVGVSLPLAGISPQHERDVRAGLRRITMQQQERKQRLGASGLERRELPIADPDVH